MNVLAKVPKTTERVGWTEKIWHRTSFQADHEYNAWRVYLVAEPRWTTEPLPSEVLGPVTPDLSPDVIVTVGASLAPPATLGRHAAHPGVSHPGVRGPRSGRSNEKRRGTAYRVTGTLAQEGPA